MFNGCGNPSLTSSKAMSEGLSDHHYVLLNRIACANIISIRTFKVLILLTSRAPIQELRRSARTIFLGIPGLYTVSIFLGRP